MRISQTCEMTITPQTLKKQQLENDMGRPNIGMNTPKTSNFDADSYAVLMFGSKGN